MDEQLQRYPSVENSLRAGRVLETMRAFFACTQSLDGKKVQWKEWRGGSGWCWSNTIFDASKWSDLEKAYHATFPADRVDLVEVEIIAVEVCRASREEREKEIERAKLKEEITKLQKKLESLG